MKRNFLFIKSTTESTVIPVDSFSHAEYTSDTTVTVYFDAKRGGKDATIAVVLTVSSGKANDVITRLTNQITSGKADIMRYDASSSPGKFHTTDVTGITSISTVEDPVAALTGQGVEPGGSTGQVLAKASSDDYDTEWVDYNTLYVTVKNTSGGTLLKGTPIHATGATADVADVIAADASIPSAMPATYVLNEDIANNTSGQAIIVGVISDIDTSSFSAGDIVYVASGGGFTNVKPTGTNAIQNLGVVIKSSASGGSGIVYGSGRSNDVPNIPDGQAWVGNASGVATPTTLANVATSGAYSDLSGTPSIPVSGVDFDPVGTDNSTDVTLAGAYDYITIAGQTITRNQVDYNTDIANTPSIPASGVDFDPVGTDNSTDVTLAGSYDYLTLSGQQITLGQVDYTTDIVNTPAIPSSLSDLTGTSDNITEGTTNKFLTAAEETKLGHISVTQAVDLDTMESDIATNNAKVSNVTTDLSTTTAASSVTVNSSDGTDATISAATTTVAGVMSGADKTKLDGISAGAEVNAVDSVNTQTGAVVLDADDIDDTSTTNKFTSASDISKLSGIEASADVTDSTNVTSSLVGATTIAAGDKTTIQTNLGVDPSGTDNSTDVTLAGAYNYLTLAGQQITLGQVDYTTDVSNTPTIPASGVDFDPVGTDNSTDVTLSGAYNYLTLLGQQITLGQVDYTTDISNTPTIPTSGVDFDPVGTDNSTDVTLAGAYNYLTLSGQQISLGQVDYTTDISNTPTIPTSGVDFDPVGTDNSTDVSINANASDVLRMAAGQVLGSEDAGADKLVFWDDSEGKLTYATIGTNLTMTADTLSASGGGSGTITALNNQAENRLTTIGATTTELDGEANLTFNGTTLTVSGEVRAEQIYVNARFPVSPANGYFSEGARLGRGFFTSGSITAGALYILGASSWTLADADAASTGSGLLVVATDAGSANEVVLEGSVKLGSNTGFSGASKGDVLYLSTTGGEVTTTAPSATGDIVRIVGYVIDPTNGYIYFKPDNTWLEL